MSIRVTSNFDFGQIVYLRTDLDQVGRQVIGVQATADGGTLIKLTFDTDISWHYECEISEERDMILATSN